jgi:phosphoribosylaminoimidazolecarboxamide formyltransferase/IMP cyclohydrolase
MAITPVTKIDGRVRVNTALISVADKTGLEYLCPRLFEINPNIKILSTGGTFQAIMEIIGHRRNLIEVSDYTGQPEIQGGLVKTLDFRIYLGFLTESFNKAHQADLIRTSARPIDLLICNLYPFKDTIASPDVTPEMARGNIDIGGVSMLRAAAKNYLRVAGVVDPADYQSLIAEMNLCKGAISLNTRFKLMKKVFLHTAGYEIAIADYMDKLTIGQVQATYNIIPPLF